ncbi:ABC transporter ATP-binding protein [Dactylosporangium sucinum]|uniref:ABC transporter ATP-binding protein n=1 Tax=Dactylosporangium sucinum TaxID=1424081 RepID=A0A917UDF9_9ACTN|nr:ABC transporter ATP-binding protein [Dactylosporangium sucinum]GGM81533.1 ABC transporter ATP-binding protein [Dactylosporangium sucinum]
MTVVVSNLVVTLAAPRGTEVVLQGVSLAVAPGEIVGIAGETGSGKTTLGLSLIGYTRAGLRQAGGEVTVAGTSVTGRTERALRALRGSTVAYVPQDPATALNPSLRLGTAFREILRAHGIRDRAEQAGRMRELYTAVQLPTEPDFARRFPHQLSGGQQQRVAIAMAFACRPQLVIMDEPTTGLDVATKAAVVALVRELSKRQGTSVVFVSHDLRLLLSFTDRIAVMYAGRIVEDGPTSQIGVAPAHPYTRALLAALPDPASRRALTALPGRSPSPSERGTGCDFAPRCHFTTTACTAEVPAVETVTPDHTARCRELPRVRHATPPAAQPSTSGRRRPNTALVEVRGLRARHGSHEVTTGVDLTVAAGECVALVGESGSGKTTIARSIAGLHTSYGGTIHLGGTALERKVTARNPAQQKAIQYVFQNPYASLNPRRSVGRSIAMAAQWLRRLDRCEAMAEALRLLDEVGLRRDQADQRPDRLSGGERQRVALARALAAQPEMLICDEVTSSLDLSVQAGIVTLLTRLRRDHGLAMLFITHDLALIRSVADRVVVLHSGRIVEAGLTDVVLDAPQHAYTRSLLNEETV